MAEHEKDVDQLSGVETTGHEWDGIKELNNPLPLWWLYIFYATVIWTIGYTIAFPAWPMISSATAGVLGYSSRMEVVEEIAANEASQKVFVDKIAAMDVTEIPGDAELMKFARAGGDAVFKTYCSQCHGSGAAGAVGYPNLNDDDWLWGGDLEAIYLTINHGVRAAEDDDTRSNDMPAFGGPDGDLDEEQIAQVVEHVLKISGQQHDAGLAGEGAAVFEENCASCHGEEGEGITDLGAPNLADAIWLYGGDRETIKTTVMYSRAGMMPAWGKRLTDAQVKQVSIWVHSRSGGQ